MPGTIDFEFRFSRPAPAPRDGDAPMRILVLADLSGRANAGRCETGEALARRRTVRVDVDGFERIMARLAPALSVSLEGVDTRLVFSSLDDFHPDTLYRRLPVFAALRELRERLADPSTFADAAAALRAAGTAPAPDAGPSTAPATAAAAAESDADTVARLLGHPAGKAGAAAPSRAGGIDAFIRRAVAPYVTPSADPFQDVYLRSLDDATGAMMRALLHHPEIQALEARWRALHALVDALDPDEALQVHALDISRQEVAADIAAAGPDLQASGLQRALTDQGPGAAEGHPWSLVVSDLHFNAAAEDVTLLAALGALAASAGGPVIAAADPGMLGCRTLAECADPAAWPSGDEAAARIRALRASAQAPWIGLCLPRLLLRLPYGPTTDPIDAFSFEELPPEEDHEAFLWGTAAFHVAALLGRSFRESGWDMQPGDHLELEDLPAHSYEDADGEVHMTPCAETFLGERAGQAMLERGLMPLLSYRNRNAARLMRVQSLAATPAPLAGAWR